MMIAYVGIVCITTYVGYLFSQKYIYRCKIYQQFIDFLNYYKLEICYNQNKLLDVVKNFLSHNSTDYIQLSQFNNYLKKEYLNCEYFVFKDEIKFLSNIEKFQIEKIYNNLGKLDLLQEKENVELNLLNFNNILSKEKSNKIKYCSLCIKVGAILGCFIIILLI